MEKLSDIVDFINDNLYLKPEGQLYFCYALLDLRHDGRASYTQTIELSEYIRESISYNAYLSTYFVRKGLFPVGISHLSDEYKLHAHAHWKSLAEKLRSEGK